MLTMEMLQEAKKVLDGVARKTPVFQSTYINPDADVYIKCENMQVTGSFKLRGAYFKTASLTDEEAQKGVIACSGCTEKRYPCCNLHARIRTHG